MIQKENSLPKAEIRRTTKRENLGLQNGDHTHKNQTSGN